MIFWIICFAEGIKMNMDQNNAIVNNQIKHFKWVKKYPYIVIFSTLTLIYILISLLFDRFFIESNLIALLKSFSFIGIAAFGQCVVLLSRGIDLSVSATYNFSGVFCAVIIQSLGLPAIIAVFICLAASVTFGLISGMLVTKLKLSPFIATIGMLSIINGFSHLITENNPSLYLPIELRLIGQGYIGPLPVSFVIYICFAVIFAILLHSTVMGIRLFAIRGNEWGAKVSGINVNGIKLFAYALSGFTAGLAGLMDAARVGFAWPSTGVGYELNSVAAAVIGIVSISNGLTTILGVIVGSLFIVMLQNSFMLLNISGYWQQIVIGITVLSIIAFSRGIKINEPTE